MWSKLIGKGKQHGRNKSQEKPNVRKEFTTARDRNYILTQGHRKL